MRKEDQKNVYGENHPSDSGNEGIDRRVEEDTASETPKPQSKPGKFERADREKVDTPRD